MKGQDVDLEGVEAVASSGANGLFALVVGTVLTALSGAVAWLVRQVLKIEPLTVRVEDVEREVEKYDNIPAQIAALKSTQEANFGEVLRSLQRLEAHTLRQQTPPQG